MIGYIHTEDYGAGLVREVDKIAEELYRKKYGKRNPATLSSLELDQIKTEAWQIVNKRRQQQ